MKYRIIVAAIYGFIFYGAVQAAQFYKWVDENGVIQYSEKPPQSGKTDLLDIRLSPSGITQSNSSNVEHKPVIIYTAEWCGVCRSAKKYFHEHGIAYTEYDVEKSIKGKVDYQRLQGKGIPIVLVGDARMDGFDAERFESMINSKKP